MERRRFDNSKVSTYLNLLSARWDDFAGEVFFDFLDGHSGGPHDVIHGWLPEPSVSEYGNFLMSPELEHLLQPWVGVLEHGLHLARGRSDLDNLV